MKRTSRKKAKEAPVSRQKAQSANLETEQQRALFESLRALRKELADEAGVPPYVVFSDAHLRDMCIRAPKTREEFLLVNGVGPAKLERYGDIFLKAISEQS